MEKIYVTPSLKAKDTLTKEARVWADEIGAAFVPRRGRTMEELQAAYGEDILVYTSRGPQLKRAEGTHFFSLNMAELRIQHIRRGQTDHLLEAIGAEGRYGSSTAPAALAPTRLRRLSPCLPVPSSMGWKLRRCWKP